MINLKIGLDGIPNPSKLLLGNKYENEDEIIQFDLPEDFSTFNKYVIGVLNNKKTHTKRTIVLPVLNDQFIVSSQLTYFDGIWELYLMAREKTLDLSRTPVDITHDKNEHVFISNPIRGVVNRSSIERENIDNMPLDSNLKIVYDDLMSLIQETIRMRDAGEFDGISPTVQIVEGEGERTIIFTDRVGEHTTTLHDYDHSKEFQDLSAQVRADAITSANSEKNAKQSETASSLSATKAKEQADLSKDFADKSEASKVAAALSETNAKASETVIEQNKVATAQSEKNAKTSETNASKSEQNVVALKQNIDTIHADVTTKSEQANISASNAKKSEENINKTVNTLATKTEVETKLDKNQGLQNSGKALMIDDSGNIIAEFNSGVVAQPEPPENTRSLWVDTDDEFLNPNDEDAFTFAEQAEQSALEAKKSEVNIKTIENKLLNDAKIVSDSANKVSLNIDKINNFDLNAQTKTSEFNSNAGAKQTELNGIVNQANTEIDTKVQDANKSAEDAKKFASRKVIVDSQTEPTDKGAIWLEEVEGTNPEAPDYNAFINKPKINGKELMGNLSLDDLEGDYELIEKIVMTEDARLLRTKEPNGEPYNFKAIALKIDLAPTKLSISGGFHAFTTNKRYALDLYYSSREKEQYTVVYSHKLHGFWNMTGGDWVDSIWTKMRNYNFNYNFSFRHTLANENITKLDTDTTVPKDSIIEVWGVRA